MRSTENSGGGAARRQRAGQPSGSRGPAGAASQPDRHPAAHSAAERGGTRTPPAVNACQPPPDRLPQGCHPRLPQQAEMIPGKGLDREAAGRQGNLCRRILPPPLPSARAPPGVARGVPAGSPPSGAPRSPRKRRRRGGRSPEAASGKFPRLHRREANGAGSERGRPFLIFSSTREQESSTHNSGSTITETLCPSGRKRPCEIGRLSRGYVGQRAAVFPGPRQQSFVPRPYSQDGAPGYEQTQVWHTDPVR